MAVKKLAQRVPYTPGELPEFLGLEDVKRELRVGKTTVYKWLKAGVLERAKIGSRTVFTRRSVCRMIELAKEAGAQ